MANAVVTSTKAATPSGGPVPATGSFDSTGADCILVWLAYGGTPTVTDNKGNTYAQATAAGAAPTGRWWYSKDANLVSVGTGHVITIGGGTTASSCEVLVLSGTAAGAPTELGATSTIPSGSTAAFGVAINPPEDNCILLVGLAAGTAGISSGITGSNGWTVPQALGGTGGQYGSLIAYKIQTTATTVASGEVYATWTGDTSGSRQQSGLLIKAAGAAGTLTITTPKAFEVHSSNGSTGSIQISGTHAGATEDIEASFNGGAYATIATASAAGAYSGTLTGQAVGQGTLSVRKKVTTTASASVANVGIGDNFVGAGDSLSEGRGTNAQVYTHATLKAADFRQDDLWKDGNDPSDTGTSIGSHWPLLATLLMADRGYPVGFITAGSGGTDVAGSNSTWAKPNADYSASVQQVTDSTVASVKAVLMQLGPNAIVNSNNAAISLTAYRDALGTLATNYATDLPGAPPTFVGLAGQVTTGAPPDRRTAEDNIRGGVLAAATLGTIKMGPNLLGQAYTDGVHPQSDALLLAVAQRWYLAIKEAFYGGAVGSSRGPRVVSAVWNIARNQMTVTFDRPLKTGLTHSAAAWKISDNGSAMTVSSIAYHGSNASALLVNTSAAVGTLGTTTVTFGSGEDATGVVIPLSADITLPVGGPIQIPAEPFYARAATEASSLATTVTVTLTTDGSTPVANQTGLKWAFWDQVNPNSKIAPVAKGTAGAVTGGNGTFSVSITGTALAAGQAGWLEVTNSDGTVNQAGGKIASGPVTTA